MSTIFGVWFLGFFLLLILLWKESLRSNMAILPVVFLVAIFWPVIVAAYIVAVILGLFGVLYDFLSPTKENNIVLH